MQEASAAWKLGRDLAQSGPHAADGPSKARHDVEAADDCDLKSYGYSSSDEDGDGNESEDDVALLAGEPLGRRVHDSRSSLNSSQMGSFSSDQFADGDIPRCKDHKPYSQLSPVGHQAMMGIQGSPV